MLPVAMTNRDTCNISSGSSLANTIDYNAACSWDHRSLEIYNKNMEESQKMAVFDSNGLWINETYGCLTNMHFFSLLKEQNGILIIKSKIEEISIRTAKKPLNLNNQRDNKLDFKTLILFCWNMFMHTILYDTIYVYTANNNHSSIYMCVDCRCAFQWIFEKSYAFFCCSPLFFRKLF